MPLADNLVKFELIGPGAIVGVDNGNQISHGSFKANQRKAFHGMALAIVQAKHETRTNSFESKIRRSRVYLGRHHRSLATKRQKSFFVTFVLFVASSIFACVTHVFIVEPTYTTRRTNLSTFCRRDQ